jgi:hypothetical protein
MRIVTRVSKTISKDDFSAALGVDVKRLFYENSYFKAVVKDGDQEVSLYFRCKDVKGLLGLSYNIFDIGIEPVKGQKDTFSYYKEQEHYKGGFRLGKLKRILKNILE